MVEKRGIELFNSESEQVAAKSLKLSAMSSGRKTSLLRKSKPVDNGEIYREKAGMLMDCIKGIGIDAKCVGIYETGMYIEYVLDLGLTQKFSALKSAQPDIQVALGCEVDFEVPVKKPGYVGIVTKKNNPSKTLLGDLIDDKEFKNAKGMLNYIAGINLQGEVIVGDIGEMPHFLIAGSTGTGKSVFVDTMIISLMEKYTPDELRIIFADTRYSNFNIYKDVPYLMGDIKHTEEEIFCTFDYLYVEMRRRYDLMEKLQVRNIAEYNRKIKSKGEKTIPRIVMFIDDVSDMVNHAERETSNYIKQLTLVARAAGIHFVLVTQNPTAKCLPQEVTYNMVGRAAFKVPSNVESRVILDTIGAENLAGYGEMLLYEPGYTGLKRIQSAYVSDDEIKNYLQYKRG